MSTYNLEIGMHMSKVSEMEDEANKYPHQKIYSEMDLFYLPIFN